MQTSRRLTLENLSLACIVLFGIALGCGPLADNSMFVHLRTGIELAHKFHVPSHDHYSFTAAGDPWVVQSWLPELTYGWLVRADSSFRLVVLEQALLIGCLFALIARLIRTGSFKSTLLGGVVAVSVIGPWVLPRPLIFGLVAFAAVLVVVLEKRSMWWLIPIFWIWGNSHGSWPIGLAWLAAYALIGLLDGPREDVSAWLHRQVPAAKYLGVGVVGALSAAIGPLGPRLLTFPLVALNKSEIFKNISEWQSPHWVGFQTFGLLGVVTAVAVLSRKQVAWAVLAPTGGLFIASMVSLRNIPLFGISLAAAVGIALRQATQAAVADGGPDENPVQAKSDPILAVFGSVIILIGFVFLGSIWKKDTGLKIDSYPVAVTEWLEANDRLGGDHRVFAQDWVGCYFLLEHGAHANVFIDDRYDMYPVQVSKDYQTIKNAEPRLGELLDHYQINTVVMGKHSSVASVLSVSTEWKQVPLSDIQAANQGSAGAQKQAEDWAVFVRSPLGRG